MHSIIYTNNVDRKWQTWNTPATVATKGHESTTSKGWAVSRISRRYRGELSARGSAAAPPRGARSGRVVSLCRTFLVTAWVYVMDRKPCCWWAPSSTLAAVWPVGRRGGGVMTRGRERTASGHGWGLSLGTLRYQSSLRRNYPNHDLSNGPDTARLKPQPSAPPPPPPPPPHTHTTLTSQAEKPLAKNTP